jgi:hypothetical protein
MHIKSQRDFFSGLLFIAVGVIFAVGASTYPMGSSANPGAGFLPLALAVLMLLLGVIVLFKSLTIETEGGDPIGSIAWRPLFVVLAAIGVFGLSIERLGLVIAVPLLIGLVSFAGGEFRWRSVVASAIVLTLFAWAVFGVALKLQMPLWPAFAR